MSADLHDQRIGIMLPAQGFWARPSRLPGIQPPAFCRAACKRWRRRVGPVEGVALTALTPISCPAPVTRVSAARVSGRPRTTKMGSENCGKPQRVHMAALLPMRQYNYHIKPIG